MLRYQGRNNECRKAPTFTRLAAIDFETASRSPDSACAVGVAFVDGGEVSEVRQFLIRPPRAEFEFTHLHGIGSEHVAHEPDFAAIWSDLAPLIEEVDYLLAHNAPFDRSVLDACCRSAGLLMPSPPFVCTMRLARAVWNIDPTKLPDVCSHLEIPLLHHRADSDAEACARIAIAAIRDEYALDRGLLKPRRRHDRRPTPVPHPPHPSTPQSTRRLRRTIPASPRSSPCAPETAEDEPRPQQQGLEHGGWISKAPVLACAIMYELRSWILIALAIGFLAWL